MKHRARPPEQDDLLRPRLIDMIDPRHELVKLAALIDWEVFESQWSGSSPRAPAARRRRPGWSPDCSICSTRFGSRTRRWSRVGSKTGSVAQIA